MSKRQAQRLKCSVQHRAIRIISMAFKRLKANVFECSRTRFILQESRRLQQTSEVKLTYLMWLEHVAWASHVRDVVEHRCVRSAKCKKQQAFMRRWLQFLMFSIKSKISIGKAKRVSQDFLLRRAFLVWTQKLWCIRELSRAACRVLLKQTFSRKQRSFTMLCSWWHLRKYYMILKHRISARHLSLVLHDCGWDRFWKLMGRKSVAALLSCLCSWHQTTKQVRMLSHKIPLTKRGQVKDSGFVSRQRSYDRTLSFFSATFHSWRMWSRVTTKALRRSETYLAKLQLDCMLKWQMASTFSEEEKRSRKSWQGRSIGEQRLQVCQGKGPHTIHDTREGVIRINNPSNKQPVEEISTQA
eukprot:765761-Hanusia_phi.AAC.7